MNQNWRNLSLNDKDDGQTTKEDLGILAGNLKNIAGIYNHPALEILKQNIKCLGNFKEITKCLNCKYSELCKRYNRTIPISSKKQKSEIDTSGSTHDDRPKIDFKKIKSCFGNWLDPKEFEPYKPECIWCDIAKGCEDKYKSRVPATTKTNRHTKPEKEPIKQNLILKTKSKVTVQKSRMPCFGNFNPNKRECILCNYRLTCQNKTRRVEKL